MEIASRVVTQEARNVFPFGLVFNDQMFGLSILASGHLEEDREKHTGPVAYSTVLFHLLNRGLWDQQLVDAPQEVSLGAVGYSTVMGEQLWATAREGGPPCCFLTPPKRLFVRQMTRTMA